MRALNMVITTTLKKGYTSPRPLKEWKGPRTFYASARGMLIHFGKLVLGGRALFKRHLEKGTGRAR